ncbi:MULTISPECIES: SGNH/GDSL hydrolase family protein [unclassified Streptomyces]|uniref:SGNH/GDSL hydrolase family protein n=1 Tax=unclassified Streptomyces TaxID=2593676 RepID=UPI0023662F9E|nr:MULTISPECIES: SGNH/GDSL hydrolase family protein [unclassified Streptomyces]MDF3144792.1 SGNH/GDSL hydrolase family protein [Streptomyces sp. T21Q-yed]WDF36090.1 SGNH/GDSL hydrolase family protein [Streptomyces sp. T12]
MTVVLSTPGLAAADDATGGKDATYYISLGDSQASGYQPDVDKDTDVAYTDQLYTQLKQRTPGLKHIRLGCTAETTESLINGGKCDYPNAKSQLDAALKAMAQHPGKVAYVTLSVGANDILLNCVSPAGTLDGACLNSRSQTMAKNLAQIAGALRKAGTENTQFVGSTYQNPFLAAWLQGAPGQQAAKESAPLVGAANAGIAQVYKSTGFKVADVAGAFSSDDFTTQVNVPGAGEVPANVAKICQLTWACTKQDPHPNADGHKVIAGVFAAQLATNDAPGAGASPTPTEPATPGAGESPTPSESAAPGSGTDTGANSPTANGDLAETGASSSTPVLAGAGLAVVAVGTAAVYFARRRRAGEES